MQVAVNIDTHVAMRDGLPKAIRPTLLEEAEADWQANPRFAGKARFFMNIHRQLLNGSDWLAATAEKLLDAPSRDLIESALAADLAPNTLHFLSFAHGHHEIEDHGYFPQFRQLYPQLNDALNLLDGDHQVLDEALNGVEASVTSASKSRDDIATLYRHAAALRKIMHRHITDEEEVIIPIFLRHG